MQTSPDFDFDLNQCKRLNLGSSIKNPFKQFQELTFQLNDGNIIRVDQIWQYHTYESRLTGFPRDPAKFIDYAVQVAKNKFPMPVEKLLVLPAVISHGVTHYNKLRGETEIIEWEMLPQITTIAGLKLTTDFEFVLAIWFQDRIGHLDAEIIEQLKRIEWKRYACKYSP